MAKLIINPTSPARRDIPLPRTVMSIGRDPSNDLVLPDAMVSRRHAVIECRGSHYFLRDCSSSNGSLVNGDRVSERSLRDGDLVAIGTVRLLFREEAELDPGAKVVPHPSAPRQHCPTCQGDYRKGDLFCRQCGQRLQDAPPRVVCTACGTVVMLPARFCNACGEPLVKGDAGDPAVATGGVPRPEADASAPAAPAPASAESPEAAGPAAAGPLGPDEVALQRSGEVRAPAAPDLPLVPAAAGQGRVQSGAFRVAAAPAEPPALSLAGPRPRPAAPLRAVQPRASESVAPHSAEAASAASEAATHGVASLPRATPWQRLVAACIDGLLVAMLQALLLLPGWLYWRSRAGDASAPGFWPILASVSLGIVVLLAGAAYHALGWAWRGATPGKAVLGLRVLAPERGLGPLGLKRALVRLCGYALSAGALGLGFAVILWGATSLHDRMAGTLVVREREARR